MTFPKNSIKTIALLLVILTVLSSALYSCGSKERSIDTEEAAVESDTAQDSAIESQTEIAEDTEKETSFIPDVKIDDSSLELTLTKMNDISFKSKRNIETTRGGVYYVGENGLYGVASYDGKYDTGAIYSRVKKVGKYFMVTKSAQDRDVEDIATLNCFGLIDAEGNSILPEEYASFEEVSDRFVYTIKVTEQTDSKDDAIIYYTESMFSLSPSEGDILFKGKWTVYDIEKGHIVKGVEGEKGTRRYAKGPWIDYYDDNGDQIRINADTNELLPEKATLFSDGTYYIKDKQLGTVYNADGGEKFTFDNGEYIIGESDGSLYLYQYKGDDSIYFLIDDKGEPASAEFMKIPHKIGNYVFADNKLCDYEGNQIIDGNYSLSELDKVFGRCIYLSSDNNVAYITKNGDVLYNQPKDSNITASSSFYLYKKVDGKDMYYSFADGDFSIEYSGTDIVAPGLCAIKTSNSKYDLYDYVTGKTIFENYNDYIVVDDTDFGVLLLVFDYTGNCEVYKVN